MPLFMNEQEYRFNHRYIRERIMNSVKGYMQSPFPISRKQYIVYFERIDTLFCFNPLIIGIQKIVYL